MRSPYGCPVCNDIRITTTLQDYHVTAKVNGDDREVNALAAFVCKRGHIFFLRRSDLADDADQNRLAQPA